MTTRFDSLAVNWDKAQNRIQMMQSIVQTITNLLPSPPTGTVLDFGCGTGLLGFHFLPKASHVTFADISQGMLDQVLVKAQGEDKERYRCVNVQNQNLEQNYDLIVSALALHHIQDYQTALGTLAEHLNPGGHLFLCDLFPEDGSFHAPVVVPHLGFDPLQIAKILTQSHLTIVHNAPCYTIEKQAKNGVNQYSLFLIQASK
jgi:2-polyprenyl-3-methyl-5-hydroxy-6-metoxy-1,4-benzoquinol methylase